MYRQPDVSRSYWLVLESGTVVSVTLFRATTLAFVALALLVTACGGANHSNEGVAVELGEEGSDGQFTFVANSWECGPRELARGILHAEATGTYCLLSIRVENTGDSSRRFVAASLRLVDNEGRTHDAAIQEMVIMNSGDFGAELNAGLARDVVLVFDVAAPFSIERAELHDGPFSRGVMVNLSGHPERSVRPELAPCEPKRLVGSNL